MRTYRLGTQAREGEIRKLEPARQIRFKMEDFANRFISGPNLPTAETLDNAIRRTLGIS